MDTQEDCPGNDQPPTNHHQPTMRNKYEIAEKVAKLLEQEGYVVEDLGPINEMLSAEDKRQPKEQPCKN